MNDRQEQPGSAQEPMPPAWRPHRCEQSAHGATPRRFLVVVPMARYASGSSKR